MGLRKRHRASCRKHRDCECPYQFKLRRKWIATGVERKKVRNPNADGRIRESLEEYFSREPLRGGGTLSTAQSLFAQFIADVDINGGYFRWREQRAGRVGIDEWTWGALVDHVVETYAKPRREAEGQVLSRALTYRYAKIREWIGPELLLGDLTLKHALKFLEALRRRGASKAYTRSYWGSFFAIVNKAVAWGILPALPFDSRAKEIREMVPSASEIEHRDRRMASGEEGKLLGHLERAAMGSVRMQLLLDCVRFILSLGYRRGTLRRLQFRDVRWEEGPHGTLRVPASKMKGRRASSKGLTPATRQILERRRSMFKAIGVYGPECYVFGKSTRQGNKGKPVTLGGMYAENDFLTAAWRTAREKAGLDCAKEDSLHLHDLRAEAACRLYEATNGDARRVMRFLDHRSLDETQKYIDRLIPRQEQEIAEIMATFERDAVKARA